MPFKLTPINPGFAAHASGIDLSKELTPSEVGSIVEAMDEFAVLVWQGLSLTADQQIRFAEHFGPFDGSMRSVSGRRNRLGDERVLDVSNVGIDGRVDNRDSPKNRTMIANQLWHSDSSFKKPRASYSMLQCLTVPSWGGNTEFADLRAAYDALPDTTKREIQELSATHFALHSRTVLGVEAYTEAQVEMLPPVEWPLVQVHRGSGRRVLFVGAHANGIPGWTLAEGRMFLADLLEHATQRQFVYAHHWNVGDFVMWDNRCTLHRGRRYDLAERRELRRRGLLVFSAISDGTKS
jgi:alpha-ketoglutarate-dependent 2,4-dichlorophenoxyacetate dioxygenase